MRSEFLMSLGVVLFASACGGSSPRPAQPAPKPAASMGHHHGHDHGDHGEGMCPLAVAGTGVAVADVDGGVEVRFTTTGDVGEVRRRVAHMAGMHAHHATRPGAPMPAADARVDDIDGGARIVLTPKDPAQLAVLRGHARAHGQQMAAGRCPMMSADAETAETPASPGAAGTAP
jgi:hypothetical protein